MSPGRIRWIKGHDGPAGNLPSDAPPLPGRPLYAVGDIHGCRNKLHRLVEAIERDRNGVDTDIVFLGDYVDRGEDSAGVLKDLLDLDSEGDGRITCLAGNHECMLLDFLDSPDSHTGRWLAIGGVNTLLSFGVLSDQSLAGRRLADVAADLAERMGPDLVAWLRRRPLWWQSGNVVAVHALTDPSLPMERQTEDILLWERPGEDPEPRHDGTWVVHGHTMVTVPTVRNRHIDVDTGACRGNPLTAVALGDGSIRFLQAG